MKVAIFTRTRNLDYHWVVKERGLKYFDYADHIDKVFFRDRLGDAPRCALFVKRDVVGIILHGVPTVPRRETRDGSLIRNTIYMEIPLSMKQEAVEFFSMFLLRWPLDKVGEWIEYLYARLSKGEEAIVGSFPSFYVSRREFPRVGAKLDVRKGVMVWYKQSEKGREIVSSWLLSNWHKLEDEFLVVSTTTVSPQTALNEKIWIFLSSSPELPSFSGMLKWDNNKSVLQGLSGSLWEIGRKLLEGKKIFLWTGIIILALVWGLLELEEPKSVKKHCYNRREVSNKYFEGREGGKIPENYWNHGVIKLVRKIFTK